MADPIKVRRDTFTGGDDSDIDARAWDGGGDSAQQPANWAKDGYADDPVNIVITDGTARQYGNNEQYYNAVDLGVSPPVVIGGGHVLEWPQLDSPGSSGSPGVGQYFGPWSYVLYGRVAGTVITPVTGLVADLVGGDLDVGGVGLLNIYDLTVHANGQPATIDAQIIGTDPTAFTEFRLYFGATAYDVEGSGFRHYQMACTWTMVTPPIDFSPSSGVYGWNNQRVELAEHGTSGATAFVRVSPSTLTPPGSGWHPSSGGPSTASASSSANPAAITVLLQGAAAGGRYEWTFADITTTEGGTFDSGTPPTPAHDGNEWGYGESVLRYDPTTSTGYPVTTELTHFTSGAPVITFRVWDKSGFFDFTEVNNWPAPPGVTPAHDLLFETHAWLTEETSGSPLLTITCNGIDVVRNYDLVANGASYYAATGRNVAIDLWGSLSDGTEIHCHEFFLLVEGGFPCEGGGDNHYPTEPPLLEDPPPASGWLRENDAWREVLLPVSGEFDGDLYLQEMGATRRGTDAAIMDFAKWRFPISLMEQPPFVPTTEPPYFDPCQTQPPPVVGSVDPTPVATGHYCGLASMRVTSLGSIFNGTQRPIGSWTPMELDQAAARGAILLIGIGTYSAFRTGTWYDPDKMDAFQDRWAPMLSSVVSHPAFGGLTYLDDFRVQHLWPTRSGIGGVGSGLWDPEVYRIAARWVSLVSGLILNIRMIPTNFSAPVPNVTIYTAQADHPFVGKWRPFRDAQTARVAGWGGGRRVNLQPNYIGGGTGVSIDNRWAGGIMTAADLVQITNDWFGDGGGPNKSVILGSTGFRWDDTYVGMVGIDALTGFRNGFMGIF